MLPIRLLLGLAALVLAGPGGRAPVDADPPLWVVRDADTTLYLFGSVHWLKEGIGWFDEGVRAAFDASDALVLESIALPAEDAQAETKALGTIERGPSLPERLPPEARPKLRAALKAVGYPEDAFDRTEPWLAATSLSVLPLTRHGYDAKYGVEAVLTRTARTEGKPVRALETTKQQLGYFDTLPEESQIAMLLRVLDNIDRVRVSNDAILKAWSAGDVAALRRIVEADLKRSPGEFSDALVAQRNARWIGWIERRLETPGTVFVAIGAGHLVGPGDMLAALEARGVTVERVRY